MCIFNIFKKHKKNKECCSQCSLNYWEIHELRKEIRNMRRLIMATKQEVLDAIAAEKAQVASALEELGIQIQALKDQIAAGDPVTAADLDDIVSAVNDIFIPAPPVEPII